MHIPILGIGFNSLTLTLGKKKTRSGHDKTLPNLYDQVLRKTCLPTLDLG